MTTAEEILEAVRELPEPQAREVLDFITFLQRRNRRSASSPQMVDFDRFGAVYQGPFHRDEIYDRKVLR